jgi:glycosyltransferase involved in cell wall biosynthesis
MRAITVRGPYKGQSGHDHHVREFVRHLAMRGIALQLLDIPEWSPVKLPEEQRDPWFDTLGAPVGARAVVHFCMPHQVRVAKDMLNVDYTMFEASRIPRRWIAHNRRHDRVVVPTAACEAAWLEGGFPRDRIRICPLGVDVARFHPAAEPLDLMDRQGRPVRDYRTRVLNVSELGPRKNLLGLMRVWIQTTARQDDAILILKLGGLLPSGVVKLLRDLDALERTIGKTRRESAPVLFVDRIFPDGQMPQLFATGTHYWSMSHGEAWDQPMVEAGATGLALIAPRHSAYRAYLDDSIATLIPARRVPARFDGHAELAPLFEGAEWWEPDEAAAAEALRQAVSGADRPLRTARARLAAGFTWEHATTRLIGILEELLTERDRTF